MNSLTFKIGFPLFTGAIVFISLLNLGLNFAHSNLPKDSNPFTGRLDALEQLK